jgi:hypothetical protein
MKMATLHPIRWLTLTRVPSISFSDAPYFYRRPAAGVRVQQDDANRVWESYPQFRHSATASAAPTGNRMRQPYTARTPTASHVLCSSSTASTVSFLVTRKCSVKHLEQALPETRATRDQRIDLITARLAAHAPFAEVLAVVCQGMVAILA